MSKVCKCENILVEVCTYGLDDSMLACKKNLHESKKKHATPPPRSKKMIGPNRRIMKLSSYETTRTDVMQHATNNVCQVLYKNSSFQHVRSTPDFK